MSANQNLTDHIQVQLDTGGNCLLLFPEYRIANMLWCVSGIYGCLETVTRHYYHHWTPGRAGQKY